MRIVCADDQLIIRRGLQLLISRRPNWTISAEAENADQLLAALREAPHDVLVTDLRLRSRSTIDLFGDIRRITPVPILILTSLPEAQYAIPALRAGARGYVGKDGTAEEILGAIENVAAGRTWFSGALAERMAQELASPYSGAPHERLSPRELDVFLRLARGETVGDIAAQLQLSIKTVSTYRTRILEKTGFRSNADIVAYAIRKHLL